MSGVFFTLRPYHAMIVLRFFLCTLKDSPERSFFRAFSMNSCAPSKQLSTPPGKRCSAMRTLMLVALVLTILVCSLGGQRPVFGADLISQDCTAVKSGIWYDPSVWSCVGVPNREDNV